MLIARLIFGLLAVASVACFAMYMATGQRRWRDIGVRIVKWTVFAGLGFFAVLLLERLAAAL
jgi:hypothetical protein